MNCRMLPICHTTEIKLLMTLIQKVLVIANYCNIIVHF